MLGLAKLFESEDRKRERLFRESKIVVEKSEKTSVPEIRAAARLVEEASQQYEQRFDGWREACDIVIERTKEEQRAKRIEAEVEHCVPYYRGTSASDGRDIHDCDSRKLSALMYSIQANKYREEAQKKAQTQRFEMKNQSHTLEEALSMFKRCEKAVRPPVTDDSSSLKACRDWVHYNHR